MANSNKEIYGLIGYPLTHSFSKVFFNQKFTAENIAAEYINFEIPHIDLVREVISENPNLQGFNITIPYKELIFPYLDSIDDDAAAIGAVNVVKLERDKKGEITLKGYNSDVIGFCDSIKPLLQPHHKKALILGTGGAAKAVKHGLHKLGIESIYVSRTVSEDTITYHDITAELLNDYHVIINTTPLGMYPKVNSAPELPYNLLNSNHLCYDLIYNPDETKFMRESRENGAQVKNGLEMLLLQAFAAWEMWQK